MAPGRGCRYGARAVGAIWSRISAARSCSYIALSICIPYGWHCAENIRRLHLILLVGWRRHIPINMVVDNHDTPYAGHYALPHGSLQAAIWPAVYPATVVRTRGCHM